MIVRLFALAALLLTCGFLLLSSTVVIAPSCNAIITGSSTSNAILTGTATALANLTCQ